MGFRDLLEMTPVDSVRPEGIDDFIQPIQVVGAVHRKTQTCRRFVGGDWDPSQCQQSGCRDKRVASGSRSRTAGYSRATASKALTRHHSAKTPKWDAETG